MSYNVEEAVEDWVLSLPRSEMDSYLSLMELKRQGTLFRLCDRLSKWVLGIYVPQATGTFDDQSQSSETRHTEDWTKDNQREGTRDMLHLLSHGGTEFQVPKEVGTLLADLIARVRSMEEQLAHHQRQAASSTRMADNRPGQNMHFEDTFSITEEREVWTRPSLPPRPVRPREQAAGGKPSRGKQVYGR